MKLCNHRLKKNRESACMLRVSDASGREWSWDSDKRLKNPHVFAKEGELPGIVFWGGYVCGEAMSKVCPYRVHTVEPKPEPTTLLQCPHCNGRHRTEKAILTCKAYTNWATAAKDCIHTLSSIGHSAGGTKEEVYPKDVLEFDGFENVRAHLWPLMVEAIKKRDKNACQDCGVGEGMKDATGLSMQFEVHHIIPRGLGGSDHPKNLKLVCHECHNRYNREFNPIIKRKNAHRRKVERLGVEPLDQF